VFCNYDGCYSKRQADQSSDAIDDWLAVRRLSQAADAALRRAVAERRLQSLYLAATDDDGDFAQQNAFDEVDDRNQDDIGKTPTSSVDQTDRRTVLRLLRTAK
jgi:hypothetical protein